MHRTRLLPPPTHFSPCTAAATPRPFFPPPFSSPENPLKPSLPHLLPNPAPQKQKKGAVIAASAWAGGLAVLLEKKSRRMELALYCASRAVEAHGRALLAWRVLSRGAAPKRADVLLFAAACAAIGHAYSGARALARALPPPAPARELAARRRLRISDAIGRPKKGGKNIDARTHRRLTAIRPAKTPQVPTARTAPSFAPST